MKIYVYILWSEAFQKKYVGMAENIETRLLEHNRGKTKSTKAFIPWRIIYFEIFENRNDARVREKYFKTSAGRRFLKTKINFVQLAP